MGKCKHNVPCGCGDTGLTTPVNACNSPACPTPDPCPETFCAGCVVYCGDDIVDLGIKKGDRMDVILQMLALHITNPGCITPLSIIDDIIALSIDTVGVGYVNGTYASVPLIGGTGTGATADITIGGPGEMTLVVLIDGGSGYTTGDVLVPDTGVVGVPAGIGALGVIVDPCRAVLGLYSPVQTTTTISLAWLAEPSAVSYQVEYKLATSSTWILSTAITPVVTPTYMIGVLLPNSAYHIRISNTCALGVCYSVTILVRTKQL